MKTFNESKGYSDIRINKTMEQLLPYKDLILEHDRYTKIYRGMDGTAVSLFGDGSKLNRKSANTSNHYTVLMSDMLPSWKEYPKRSKSFVCSASKKYAGGYGNETYIVIPLENQNFGVCSRDDLWNSFQHMMKILKCSDLEVFIEALNSVARLTIGRTLSETPEVMAKQLEMIKKIVVKHGPLEDESSYIDNRLWKLIRTSDQSLLQLLNSIMDPTANRFKLLKHSEIPGGNREVWLSGKVLFVTTGLNYSTLIKNLKQS